MANDATNKSTSSSFSGSGNVGNNSENSNSAPATDQQKVPPLRIVLNTSGNQKSSSTIATVDNESLSSSKKDRDSNNLKSRVRIKLGTNKQQTGNNNNNTSNNNNHTKDKSYIESTSNKSTATTRNSGEDNFNDETSSSSFTHLRRITRRSQRTIQPINNEDDESISSMTSIDDNVQNSIGNTANDSVQDSEQSNQTPSASTSGTNTTNSATNGSNAGETPRRYKRRKGEPSESQSLDAEIIFGSQSYKLPDQNSIELFKNIRKQVDKRLKNLNSIAPRAPHGFRDYILSRGAYLLDGNKLGNGTNLFMNEDGGLNPLPVGKYHAIRQNRINYTVPNRAKVPSGLAIDSPLYNLFIDQEKDRHRMRMQHIKEREKLTLAAEQEIIRVYNQAALLASNQTEPFSACTMLKHQEIYDYLTTDGKIILSRENAQHDQVKPDGVRTRRRQHGHISPPATANSNQNVSQSRKSSNADEVGVPAVAQAPAGNVKDEKTSSSTKGPSSDGAAPTASSSSGQETKKESENSSLRTEVDKKATGDNQSDVQMEENVSPSEANDSNPNRDKMPKDDEQQSVPKEGAVSELAVGEKLTKDPQIPPNLDESSKQACSADKGGDNPLVKQETNPQDEDKVVPKRDEVKSEVIQSPNGGEETKTSTQEADDGPTGGAPSSCGLSEQNSEESQQESCSMQQQPNDSSSVISSDEDRKARNREMFLIQLQEVDDKWDRMRKEMLIRHKNEAESLYAVQKLEWEWKAKEIGACDVRATPVIDTTLVPKLNIYPQDY